MGARDDASGLSTVQKWAVEVEGKSLEDDTRYERPATTEEKH